MCESDGNGTENGFTKRIRDPFSEVVWNLASFMVLFPSQELTLGFNLWSELTDYVTLD